MSSPFADRRLPNGSATANGERRTANLLPLALLALIALLLFARPLVRAEVLNFRDHSDYFQPLRLFTAQELRRGHLPLWNPYNASGEPWLANPQTGVFYPPTWIFLVVPFATAYTLFLALHVALLGCGAFILFRRFASPSAAFLGALSLMLCGPSLSLLDVSNTLTTFAWIPLVLWCALANASPARSAVAIAMCFLAGEPFFAACAALMFLLIRRSKVIDIAATSFALSAIQLFPFLAMIHGSDRAGHVPADEILRDSMPLSDWASVVLSPAFADITAHQRFVPIVYVGLVAACLAVLALVKSWRRRAVHVSLAVVVGTMILAAGSYFAPSAFLLTHAPVAIVRYPSRMLPLAAIAICFIAAIGFDAIARWRWLPFALTVLILADLAPVIAPLVQSAPFNPHPTPYSPSLARDGKLVRLMRTRAPMSLEARQLWISGYQNLFDRRFDVWTAAPLVPEGYTRAYEQALERRDRLNEMSVGYVLSDQPISRLPLITQHRSVMMYRNPEAYPIAYWRGNDGRIVPAALLAFTTTAAHITIDAPADGTIVMTQQNARGWYATVDAAVAPTADGGIFRALRVARGRHDVSWHYRPPLLIAGAIVTAIGLARLLLSLSFVKGACRKFFFQTRLQASKADVESRSSNKSV